MALLDLQTMAQSEDVTAARHSGASKTILCSIICILS
jgi:hypothetical protein